MLYTNILVRQNTLPTGKTLTLHILIPPLCENINTVLTLSLELSQKLRVGVVQKFPTSHVRRSAFAAPRPGLLSGVLSLWVWGSSSTPFHSSDPGNDFLFLQKTPLHTLVIDTFHREVLQTQIKQTPNSKMSSRYKICKCCDVLFGQDNFLTMHRSYILRDYH